MKLAIPRERAPGEHRVAAVPAVSSRLIATGAAIAIEAGAGESAFYSDDAYREAGLEVFGSAADLLNGAGLVCKVQPPSLDEVALIPAGAGLVSFLQPGGDLELVKALAERGVSTFSLDLLPRISRAQAMDTLSSQATVSGYRSGLLAAEHLPKFFPMFMTAAGTVPPAKVLVLGAGVAGLQAIATVRRLGAVARAYDVRPAAKEEVKSLGAAFVELALESQEGEGGYAREQSEDFLARQRELIGVEVAAADVVITTAAIPGRRAPVLVTAEMIEAMKPGSVVIDLAAESGGNCEGSLPGEIAVRGGVTLIGTANLPSSMPMHASFLYARNVAELVGLLVRDGELAPDFEDEIVDKTCVTHAGEIRHEATRTLIAEGSK